MTANSRTLGRGLLLAATLLPSVVSTHVFAQKAISKQGVAVQRVCEGKVVEKNGKAVSDAVVYLKNANSLAVQSYLSDDQGSFHFRQVQPDTDYILWAESKGRQSKTKRIGMFNSHAKLVYTLKMK